MDTAKAAQRPIALILLLAAAGAYWLFAEFEDRSIATVATDATVGRPDVPATSTLHPSSPASRGKQQAPDDRYIGSSIGSAAGEHVSGERPASEAQRVLPTRSSRETIEARLRDPDPVVRIDAIHRMFGVGMDKATRMLQALLLTERDGDVAEEATAALRAIGGDDAVAAVTTGVADPDNERRRVAIASLARVGSAAVSLLGQVLFTDPDPELRRLAVEQLSQIATPAAISLLSKAQTDGDPRVAQAASDALSGSGDDQQVPKAAVDVLLSAFDAADDPLPPGLVEDLSSDNEQYVRIDAMQRIHELEEDQAVGVLTHLLQWDQDPDLRTEALFALETYSDEAADQAVAIALGDDSPDLRHEGLLALWATGNSDRYLVAAQLLQSDPDITLRREALRLLVEDSNSQAKVLLDMLLTGSEESTGTAAAPDLEP